MEIRNRTRVLGVAAFLWVALLTPMAAGQDVGDYGELEESIVAKVNDEIITRSELEALVLPLEAELLRQTQGKNLEERRRNIRRAMLEDKITSLVLLQAARQRGLSAPPNVIDTAIQNLMQETNIVDMDTFKQLLKENTGLTLAEYRKKLEEDYLQIQLINYETSSRLIVSQLEIEDYYQAHQEEYTTPVKVHLREITLLSHDDKTLVIIQSVARQLQQGIDFVELVNRYSEAPSRNKGGDLGFFEPGQLQESLEVAAFDLKPGEFSEVIKTPVGYTILQLIEKQEQMIRPLDEVRMNIQTELQREKREKSRIELIEEIRKNAYIEYLDPEFAPLGN